MSDFVKVYMDIVQEYTIGGDFSRQTVDNWQLFYV